MIISSKLLKELTVKSEASVLRFSTLPHEKYSDIPLSNSLSRECWVILNTNWTADPSLDFKDL